MPQPLSSKKINGALLQLSDDATAHRPQLASLIMQVIGLWSSIDHHLLMLLCSLLKSEFKTVAAIYDEIVNARIRTKVITRAAEVALRNDPEGIELIERTLASIKASRGRRDEFAHHLWIFCPQIDDGICLIDPRHLSGWAASVTEAMRHADKMKSGEIPTEPQFISDFEHLDYDKVMVYTERDLKNDIRDAQRAHDKVFILNHCFRYEKQARDQARLELSRALSINN